MKMIAFFLVIFVTCHHIFAHPLNSRLIVPPRLIEHPRIMTVMDTPKKTGYSKEIVIPTRPGRSVQWDLRGSEVPFILLEDLISEQEYTDTGSMIPQIY